MRQLNYRGVWGQGRGYGGDHRRTLGAVVDPGSNEAMDLAVVRGPRGTPRPASSAVEVAGGDQRSATRELQVAASAVLFCWAEGVGRLPQPHGF